MCSIFPRRRKRHVAGTTSAIDLTIAASLGSSNSPGVVWPLIYYGTILLTSTAMVSSRMPLTPLLFNGSASQPLATRKGRNYWD